MKEHYSGQYSINIMLNKMRIYYFLLIIILLTSSCENSNKGFEENNVHSLNLMDKKLPFQDTIFKSEKAIVKVIDGSSYALDKKKSISSKLVNDFEDFMRPLIGDDYPKVKYWVKDTIVLYNPYYLDGSKLNQYKKKNDSTFYVRDLIFKTRYDFDQYLFSINNDSIKNIDFDKYELYSTFGLINNYWVLKNNNLKIITIYKLDSINQSSSIILNTSCNLSKFNKSDFSGVNFTFKDGFFVLYNKLNGEIFTGNTSTNNTYCGDIPERFLEPLGLVGKKILYFNYRKNRIELYNKTNDLIGFIYIGNNITSNNKYSYLDSQSLMFYQSYFEKSTFNLTVFKYDLNEII